MSTILASPTNITPALPMTGRTNAVWNAFVLEGRFYFAWLGYDPEKKRESRSILRFVPRLAKWETVYQRVKSLRRDRQGDHYPGLPADALSVFLTGYPLDEKEVLYARFLSPLGEARLCSAENGENFRSVHASPNKLAAAPNMLQMAHGPDARYALFAKNGHHMLGSLVAGKGTEAWSELCPPSSPSRIAMFNGQLTVSSDDAVRGFDLWTMSTTEDVSPGWRSLVTRGAYRYSMNARIFACLPWREALYIACGRAEGDRAHRYQEGFEILRIYPDASWDLVIGTPRVSEAGLKVPLACLGPGTDEFQPSEFRFLTATASHLELGTYEDAAGLCIWHSPDGSSWTRASNPEFAGMEKVRSASAFQIPEGTALLLEMDSPLHGRTFGVWFLYSD